MGSRTGGRHRKNEPDQYLPILAIRESRETGIDCAYVISLLSLAYPVCPGTRRFTWRSGGRQQKTITHPKTQRQALALEYL